MKASFTAGQCCTKLIEPEQPGLPSRGESLQDKGLEDSRPVNTLVSAMWGVFRNLTSTWMTHFRIHYGQSSSLGSCLTRHSVGSIHYPDLVGTLRNVLLVDAQGVCPDEDLMD